MSLVFGTAYLRKLMAAFILGLAGTQQAGADELAEWSYSSEAGAVKPEYTRNGTSVIFVYGWVPDDFLPTLPPQDMVIGTLDILNTQDIWFRMQKNSPSSLTQVTIKHFQWGDVAPKSTCFEQESPADEIGLRVCEDLAEMSFDHHPPLLACDYGNERRGLMADALYWYGAQPAAPVADPANFLKRSRDHPLIKIAEPRTACPATIEEARQIHGQHRSRLESLGVQEIAATIQLRSEREKQRQAEAEERGRRESEARAALADFPLIGAYKLEATGERGSIAGDCLISKGDRDKTGYDESKEYFVSCVDVHGEVHFHLAGFVRDELHVNWYLPESLLREESLFYMVDLEYRRAGRGNALVSIPRYGSSMRESRLIRVGDTSPADAYGTPLEELPELKQEDAERARIWGITSLENLAALRSHWKLAEAAELARQFLKIRLPGQFHEARAIGTSETASVTTSNTATLGDQSSPAQDKPPAGVQEATKAPTPPDALSDSVAGKYRVEGKGPNGSPYKGTCVVTKTGEKKFRFEWTIGGQRYSGTGWMIGSTVTVDWGDPHPLIYTIAADGTLDGTWANGRAAEKLKRTK